MECTFGVDIGGTEIKIGKFYKDKLIYNTSIKTDISKSGENIFHDIYKKIEELLDGDQLTGIGVGVPGPVVDGVVLGAQNINWDRVDALNKIKIKYPNIKVKILNDANSAALGEFAYGSATLYNSVVFMTLGTGIGGALIIDGKLIEGKTGSTGEFGHIRVSFDDRRKCTCGLYDCVEQYASATGIVLTANELRFGRKSILNEIDVTSKNIFESAKKGDQLACEVVDIMVEKLSSALAAVANTVNPEAIIIGGGVSRAGDFLLEKLEKRFKELAFFSVRDTRLHLATLGNDAGIYGCNYEVIRDYGN